MKITLKDIASELGMNESTVSYALANKGSIKAETRERILRTAAKMGYVPNRSAQQVSTGKSNLIGLVVPNVLFELGEYCEHIFHLLSDAGYLTSIMVTEFSPERERSIFRNLIGQGAAGIIVCPTTHRANPSSSEESPLHLARLNGVPVICRNIDPQENCVMPDYHAIGSLLGGKLRKCGHRDIALMIPHSAPFPAFFDDLRNGVLETLGKRADVRMEAVSGTPALCPDGPFPTNPHYELQMRSMLAAGYIEATEELFRQVWHSPRKRPDAMICFSENTAVGLIAAARKCGVEIPRDLSLVTTQHTLFGNFLPVPVTAAYVPPLEFAEKTVELLLKKIHQNTNQTEQVLLKPEFFPGGTLHPRQKETI